MPQQAAQQRRAAAAKHATATPAARGVVSRFLPSLPPQTHSPIHPLSGRCSVTPARGPMLARQFYPPSSIGVLYIRVTSRPGHKRLRPSRRPFSPWSSAKPTRSRRSAQPTRTARSRLLARPRSRTARRRPFTRPSRTQRSPPLASLRFAACPSDPRSRSRRIALPSPGHRASCLTPAIAITPQLPPSPTPTHPPSQASRLRARNLPAA